ncbi:MAG: hypothetical protein AAB809_00375 [Patescibacteria group bacterium]
MATNKKPKQIKSKIDELDQMIGGLSYYFIQKNIKNDTLNGLFEEHESLMELSLDKQLGLREIFKRLFIILQRMRKTALDFGISKGDVTDEKLKGYSQMLQAEEKQEEIEREKKRKAGISLETSLPQTIFPKGKIH